jgi:hypothetical protein
MDYFPIREVAPMLLNRSLHAFYSGLLLSPSVALSGVLQETVLGPLLLMLFVNDLREVINNTIYLLYADDLQVLRATKFPSHCLLLESDADSASAGLIVCNPTLVK